MCVSGGGGAQHSFDSNFKVCHKVRFERDLSEGHTLVGHAHFPTGILMV